MLCFFNNYLFITIFEKSIIELLTLKKLLGRNVPFLSKLNMLYMVLHGGMKGASIAKKIKIHNSGILGIWEIKCTKYLFRYTHKGRGHYSFIYISKYCNVHIVYEFIYLFYFIYLFSFSIGLRGRIWFIVCLSGRRWSTSCWQRYIFGRLVIASLLICIILFPFISVSFPTNTPKKNHSNQG